MFKTSSKENKYGLIWLRVICVFVSFCIGLLASPKSLQMLRVRMQQLNPVIWVNKLGELLPRSCRPSVVLFASIADLIADPTHPCPRKPGASRLWERLASFANKHGFLSSQGQEVAGSGDSFTRFTKPYRWSWLCRCLISCWARWGCSICPQTDAGSSL